MNKVNDLYSNFQKSSQFISKSPLKNNFDYEVNFPPGSMGLELEPVIVSSDRKVGCKVKDFYFSLQHDGINAEYLQSIVSIGDIVSKINSQVVLSLPFSEILSKLRLIVKEPKTITFKNISTEWLINSEHQLEEQNIKADKVPSSKIRAFSRENNQENVQNSVSITNNEDPYFLLRGKVKSSSLKKPLSARPLDASPIRRKSKSPLRRENISLPLSTLRKKTSEDLMNSSTAKASPVLDRPSSPFTPSDVKKLMNEMMSPKKTPVSKKMRSLSKDPLPIESTSSNKVNKLDSLVQIASGSSLGSNLVNISSKITSKAADVTLNLAGLLSSHAEKVISQTTDSVPFYSASEMNEIMGKKNELLKELSQSAYLLGQSQEREKQLLSENLNMKSLEQELEISKAENESYILKIKSLEAQVAVLKNEEESSIQWQNELEINNKKLKEDIKCLQKERRALQEHLSSEKMMYKSLEGQHEMLKTHIHENEIEWSTQLEQMNQEQETLKKDMYDALDAAKKELEKVQIERDQYIAELEVLRDMSNSDRSKAESEFASLRENIVAQQEWHRERIYDRDNEINSLREEISNIQSRLKTLQFENSSLNKSKALAESQLNETQKEKNSLKLEIGRYLTTLSERSDLLEQAQEEVSRLKNDLSDKEKEILVMEANVSSINKDKDLLKLRLESKDSEIKSLSLDIDNFISSNKEKEYEFARLQSNLNDQASKNEELQSQINHLNLKIDSLSVKYKQEKCELNEALLMQKNEIDLFKVKAHEIQNNGLEAAQANKQEIQSLTKSITELQAQIVDFNGQLRAKQEEIESKNIELSSFHNVIELNEDKIKHLEQKILDLLSSQCDMVNKKDKELEAFESTNKELEHALHAANEKLDKYVDDYKQGLSLKSSEIECLKAQLETLNQSIQQKDQAWGELNSKLESKEKSFLEAIRLTEQTKATQSAELTDQINQLEQDKESLQTHISFIQSEKLNLGTENKSLSCQLSALRSEFESVSNELNVKSKRLCDKYEEEKEYLSQLSYYKIKFEDLNQLNRSLELDQTTLQDKVASLEAELEKKAKELENAHSLLEWKNNDFMTQIQRYQNDYNQIKAELVEKSNFIESLKKKQIELKRQLEAMAQLVNQNLFSLRKDLNSQRSIVNDYTAGISEHFRAYLQQIGEYGASIDKDQQAQAFEKNLLQSRIELLEGGMADSEKKINRYRNEIETLKSELIATKEKNKKADSEIAHLETQVNEMSKQLKGLSGLNESLQQQTTNKEDQILQLQSQIEAAQASLLSKDAELSNRLEQISSLGKEYSCEKERYKSQIFQLQNELEQMKLKQEEFMSHSTKQSSEIELKWKDLVNETIQKSQEEKSSLLQAHENQINQIAKKKEEQLNALILEHHEHCQKLKSSYQSDLEGVKVSHSNQKQAMEKQMETLRASLYESENQSQKYKLMHQTSSSKIIELESALDEASRCIASQKRSILDLESHLSNAHQAVERAFSEYNNIKLAKESLEIEKEALANNFEQKKLQWDEKMIALQSELSQSLASESQKSLTVTSQLESIQKELENAHATATKYQLAMTEKDDFISTLQNGIRELSSEIESIRSSKQQLKDELKDLVLKKESSEVHAMDLEKRLEDRTNELDSLSSVNQQQKDEIQRFKSEVNSLQSSISKHTHSISEVKSILSTQRGLMKEAEARELEHKQSNSKLKEIISEWELKHKNLETQYNMLEDKFKNCIHSYENKLSQANRKLDQSEKARMDSLNALKSKREELDCLHKHLTSLINNSPIKSPLQNSSSNKLEAAQDHFINAIPCGLSSLEDKENTEAQHSGKLSHASKKRGVLTESVISSPEAKESSSILCQFSSHDLEDWHDEVILSSLRLHEALVSTAIASFRLDEQSREPADMCPTVLSIMKSMEMLSDIHSKLHSSFLCAPWVPKEENASNHKGLKNETSLSPPGDENQAPSSYRKGVSSPPYCPTHHSLSPAFLVAKKMFRLHPIKLGSSDKCDPLRKNLFHSEDSSELARKGPNQVFSNPIVLRFIIKMLLSRVKRLKYDARKDCPTVSTSISSDITSIQKDGLESGTEFNIKYVHFKSSQDVYKKIFSPERGDHHLSKSNNTATEATRYESVKQSFLPFPLSPKDGLATKNLQSSGHSMNDLLSPLSSSITYISPLTSPYESLDRKISDTEVNVVAAEVSFESNDSDIWNLSADSDALEQTHGSESYIGEEEENESHLFPHIN